MKTSIVAFFFSFFAITTLSLASHAQTQVQQPSGIDLVQLEKDLNTNGIQGWIHGAAESKDLFVFTFRNPKNFFDYLIMPLTTEDAQLLQFLQSLNRHDEVKIKGTFVDNRAPVKHIDLAKIEIVQAFDSEINQTNYYYKGNWQEIVDQQEMVARVHALSGEGQMLVVEYKDLIVPVFIKDPADQQFVKGLYRGDKIRLRYTVQKKPHTPIHLNPKNKADLQGQPAIELLLSLVKTHGQPIERTGNLIFFPKSPEINRNIFALQEVDSDDEPIQYTLVNFEDPDVFAAILAKLQKVWDEQKSLAVNARNKMVNLHIQVKAKGTMNMVSQSQANPQILLNSADDLQITVTSPAPQSQFVGAINFKMNKI